MDRWAGKVALVTGASAGIGAAIAEELVKHGLKVVGLARRVDKVEALKKLLPKDAKGELHPLQGDVSKEEDILQAFKWIKDKFGTIHVLVNNAGVMRNGLLTEASPDLFKQVLDTNVLGLTICTQQAFKLMKTAGVDDGYIIHINSVVGRMVPNVGDPVYNVYPASKHAVTALTESYRLEFNFLKTNTRITSISPGYVATELIEAGLKGSGIEPPPEFNAMLAAMPSLHPSDIADAVVYVLSTPPRVQIHDIIIKPRGELV